MKQVFTLFPLRAMRWLRHIIKLTPLLPKSKQQWWEQHRYHRFAWAWWSFEWALMTLELLGVFELYESIIVLKPSCRPINSRERHLVASMFPDSFMSVPIWIDKRSYIICPKTKIAYVSFHTINVWGSMRGFHFLHEVTHVWHYKQMGAVYIAKALYAQFTSAGYNYGGIVALLEQREFLQYNLEQQADIIADTYRLRQAKRTLWGEATIHDLPIYEQVVAGVGVA
ncbi:MAG: hypothetical protein KA974_06985 [Saprospiraceae bacterium]|nr:hypothetical protein [Saprospiraceae bacterium]MBP7699860.1 hypothetical protein [Saprospiraceae bacterium]